MRNGSLALFHVRGVPVKAHWTLLLIIPYLAITLSYQFTSIAILAGVEPAGLVLPPLLWGALLAIGLFASVALHELAHTLLALRYGGRVRSITLMLLGGAAQLSRAPKRPRDEAIMAAAGPALSFVLGFTCAALYSLVDLGPDWQMSLFYLAGMNISLALFNLLPAFPMDGGRVLRAVLASRLGHARATQVAATIGKICAAVLGIVAIMHLHLLLGLIALFLYAGASGELAGEQLTDSFAALTVADLLPRSAPVPVVAASLDLDAAAHRMTELDRLDLVVADPQGPIAILEADDVPRLSVQHTGWPLGSLAPRLATPFIVVPTSETANAALAAAAERDARYLVVMDAQRAVVGLVGPADIARTLKLRAMQPAGGAAG